MVAIIGVEAIRMLNTGSFQLRTREEIDGMQFGPYSRRILNEVYTKPIDEPLRAGVIAKKIGLTEKQTSLSLECMVNRRDQVFTKFKDPDILKYSMQYASNRPPQGNGWFREAILDLDQALDELGASYLAVRLERLFSRYNKLPWKYVPLIKYNEQPIYSQMQLNLLKII